MAEHWRIRGYDSTNLMFERNVPADSLSEAQIVELLKCLAATKLNDGEVISSILGNAGHLAIKRNGGGGPDFITDGNPWYTADLS
ncbi:hypothetical protein SAMN06265365_106203 [Tistlia consotensis]|uniref:Uncharacterized protein n=1 Tax=Tistlia consotensis USBA 355 TaxID=560819 RepID=A0A1Y6BK30_9PROT|nr:hypothetical protein [Tistlia consotensis]SMF05217.1 hypothetical protein SAMN05428998_103254 [Tistlia consotensis USBA 355]SNR55132.1 hypothetical protein SAMN06265365_106203 [Tistlia consotensis]